MPIELPQGSCIFCERISGEYPEHWAVIEERDLTIAVLNPRQHEEGQSMVLPVRHAPTLLDLTDDEAAALLQHAKRIAEAMVAVFDPDGVTLWQNNGVASLQEVPHVHLHVVPRRYGGGFGEGPPHLAALTREDREGRFRRNAAPLERLAALAERIRGGLA